MAVIPVLAVTRQGGQTFVYVAKQQANGKFDRVGRFQLMLGDTVGNTYSITSGLNAGDQVIVSSTQFLVNGMPVISIPGMSIPSSRMRERFSCRSCDWSSCKTKEGSLVC